MTMRRRRSAQRWRKSTESEKLCGLLASGARHPDHAPPNRPPPRHRTRAPLPPFATLNLQPLMLTQLILVCFFLHLFDFVVETPAW